MDDIVWAAIIPVIGGPIVAALNWRRPKEPKQIHQSDPFGELKLLLDTEREQRIQDVKDLKAEVHELSSDLRVYDDYVNQLRQDIIDGRPPPPREWPSRLVRRT